MRDRSLRVTYVGHATVLLEMDGVRVLTDPILRPRVAHLHRVVPLQPMEGGALDRLDAVLISHLHHDHFDVPSLRLLGRHVTVVVPGGGAVRSLERHSFTDVRGAREGTVMTVGPLEVRAVHAQHPGSRGVPWMRGPALGYVLTGSRSVYFAGDTDLFGEMAGLSGTDVALLPVAGWGPRLPEGEHMDPRRAAQALAMLRPRIAVPIHWGTLAPLWSRHAFPLDRFAAEEFRRHAAEVAPEVEVQVLAPGQSFVVPDRRRNPGPIVSPGALEE